MERIDMSDKESWQDQLNNREKVIRKIKWHIKYERRKVASMKKMINQSQDVKLLYWELFKLNLWIENYDELNDSCFDIGSGIAVPCEIL